MNMATMKRSWSLSSGGLATLVLVASISGCSYIEQAQDNPPMTSVLEVNRAQTMNPAASANRKAVAGLNGEAGRNVSDAYAKSFTPKEAGGGNDLFLGLQGVGGAN
jgi:hypothetical protein